MSDSPALVRLAGDAYEAVRSLNHHSIHGAVPAPVLYDVLGHLTQLGPALQQALGQLGDGLARSLDEYDVYEDDGAAPAASVTACRDALTRATADAARLAHHLAAAREAITRQGYRT